MDFAEWFAQYPLPVDERFALKQYRTERKAGTSREDLMQGAMQYAAECRGKDPQWIKKPANWLKAGSWNNKPTLFTQVPTTNGASNVHKLTRDYQQDRDSTVRALYAAIPGLRETCADELGDRRAGSF
jgi:hypothetical protein